MTKPYDPQIGDVVWWNTYGNELCTGKVIARHESGTFKNEKLCVERTDGFSEIETRGTIVYATQDQAKNALAMKKQREAAKLLESAAKLFGEIGVNLTAADDDE